MTGVHSFLGNDLLDWHLGGAAATSIQTRAVALATGGNPPTMASAYELTNTDVVSYRLPVTYLQATAGSASNSNAITFSSFVSTRTIIGLTIWNNTTSGAGSMLWFGTLSAARTPNPGDSLVFNSGAIVHSIT